MIEYTVKVDVHRTRRWYLNGKHHREDGPAVEYADGTKYWYRTGELHREDGPASEWADGDRFWYLNGKLHREDGPAIEYASGNKYWYLNGKKLTEEQFNCRNNVAAVGWRPIADAPLDGRYVEIKCADGSWGNARWDRGRWNYQFNYNKCYPTHFRLIK